MSTTGDPATTQASEDPRGVPRPARGGGNVRSMVISMAVILGIVMAVVLLLPRPNSIQQPAADVPNAASGGVRTLSFTPPVPLGLDGWEATSAEVNRSTDDIRTWHVGYRTAAGKYVSIEVARDVTPAWQRAQIAGGSADGEQTIDGETWQRFLQPERDRHSLVREQGGVTVIATGEGDYTVLGQLARGVEAGWAAAGVTWGDPADPSAPVPTPTATAAA
ncbi:DUF4245 family protein [Kineococcus sp. R8]|uniref:DUF4245 family protein n=1 Tax=Kineococcus siccus TaxID=2696567 RepID=UPI0014126C42|nr:DUF4245 family protein [Kineococcus siccus]